MRLPVYCTLAIALAACNPATTADPEVSPEQPPPKTIASYKIPSAKRWTTLKNTWLANEAGADTKSAILTGLIEIDDLASYAVYGLDNLMPGAGEPHVFHDEISTSTRTTARRSLLYFAQYSDLHIVDEESPVRLEGVTRIAFASAYRPQDHLTTQMVDALIQSMNAFSFEDRPFDFAFITGDISDNAQENEVTWVRELFDGGVVVPDSGIIDDPFPDAQDFTDPFQAAGVDKRVPWYVLFGNHEQMHLGSFNPIARIKDGAVGNRINDYWGLSNFSNATVTFGARDASRPYAPVVREGTYVPADPRRKMLMNPVEFMQLFITSPTKPTGHGFSQKNIDSGFTSYIAHPVAGFPLTMIALDTVSEMKLNAAGEVIQQASSEGEISRELWDGFVIPELEKAQANGELILFTSHHCSGSVQAGEVKAEELRTTLKKYPNVLAHLCGHGHRTRLWIWDKMTPGEHGYPELMQASAVDWPIQGRILELVDNGDGTLSLFTTQVEPNVTPEMLAHEGMRYAASAGNFPPISLLPERMWDTDRPHRNMEVVIPVPAGFNLGALPGHSRIESLTRLAE